MYTTSKEVRYTETINDRFRQIYKDSGLSQEKFAQKINRGRGEVANIIYNKTEPKDAIIKSVCSAFGCNEIWLRTGDGEPFQKASRQEEILRFAAQSIKGSDDFLKSFVYTLTLLDAEDWKALSRIFQKLANEQNEK